MLVTLSWEAVHDLQMFRMIYAYFFVVASVTLGKPLEFTELNKQWHNLFFLSTILQSTLFSELVNKPKTVRLEVQNILLNVVKGPES